MTSQDLSYDKSRFNPLPNFVITNPDLYKNQISTIKKN